LFISFWRSRHILWRARKQILPLIWLNFAVLSTWPNLPTGLAAWPLLRFLFVSGVSELQIRRGQTHWKANTPNYNFYEGNLPRFYHLQVQTPLGTRATNLPCFVNGEGISNFFFFLSPILLPHQIQPCFHLMHGNLERRFLFLTSYN
jgi:hypothetical protein